ncbi:unnamed protein product, partial [Urochloa humidicola]
AAVAGDGAVGGGCVAGGDRASWIEAGPLPRPPCAAQPHHRIPLLLPRRSRRVGPLPQALLRARLGLPLARAAPTRARCGLRRRGAPCGVVFKRSEGDDEDGKVLDEIRSYLSGTGGGSL